MSDSYVNPAGVAVAAQPVVQVVNSLPVSVSNPLPVIGALPTGSATAANQATEIAALGAPADAAVTNPASSGSIIAWLKGLITLMYGVASGTADSGNPVKIGGKYNSTLPTFTNGQRGDFQISQRGINLSNLYLNDTQISSLTATDSSSGQTGVPTTSRPQTFNGTTWDRFRGNQELTLLASAARTATVSTADQTNYNGKGAVIIINVTAAVSSPSVVVTVEGKGPVSGAYYTILTSAAIVGTGTTVLRVRPGITPVTNLAVADILPRTWRVTLTHGNSDSITYSVGVSNAL